MRTSRAYLAGFGTAGSLLAGFAILFVVASAIVSFGGWPNVSTAATPSAVAVPAAPAPAARVATPTGIDASLISARVRDAVAGAAPAAGSSTSRRGAGGAGSLGGRGHSTPGTAHNGGCQVDCTQGGGPGSTGTSTSTPAAPISVPTVTTPPTLVSGLTATTQALAGIIEKTITGVSSSLAPTKASPSPASHPIASTVQSVGSTAGNTVSSVGNGVGSAVAGTGTVLGNALGGTSTTP